MVDKIQEIKFNPTTLQNKNEAKKYYNTLLEIIRKMDKDPSNYPEYIRDKNFLLDKIKKYGDIENAIKEYLNQETE